MRVPIAPCLHQHLVLQSFKIFLPFIRYVVATHSSTLAWQIPWTEEPGRLQSMGSIGVRHDWTTSLSLFTFMHWRRKWQPTPVFVPGESQGRGSLVGCCLWGRTESDMTEATQQQCLIMTNSAEHFFFFFAIGIYLVKWLLECFDICFFLLVVSLLSFQSSLF